MDGKGTTCPITNATVIATTSLRPTVPDRQAFQQELRNYNQSISETVAKIDRIIGRDFEFVEAEQVRTLQKEGTIED